jgi:hypothetical protein
MIIANCNVNKLHDEFNKAGINPFPVFQLENGNGDFVFPDGTDMTAVQAIIDAHNPEPLPPQPTEIEKLRLEQAKANSEMIDLMMALIYGGM